MHAKSLPENIISLGKARKPYFMGVPEIILEHDGLTDILREGFECTEKCAWCTGFWAGGKKRQFDSNN